MHATRHGNSEAIVMPNLPGMFPTTRHPFVVSTPDGRFWPYPDRVSALGFAHIYAAQRHIGVLEIVRKADR